MSSNDAAVEVALLEIAKDLLQASDDMAATDPSASAKLAHEAYEIGRDLGIVRNHVDDPKGHLASNGLTNGFHANGSDLVDADLVAQRRREAEDEAEDDLLRILDRQRAIVPHPSEITPTRKPSRKSKPISFESVPSRRSGWFGWIRPREWRHAG
ncbi:MAG: hypothetical protein ACR2Q4_03195 [Geminicoccaceae bacterium]